MEFNDQHITHIIDRFEKPLQNSGFETADVIEEWHDLISCAIAFLDCSSTNYLRTWHCIFNSEKCKIEFKNILLVAELAFCLPVSTAKLERSFSMFKHIKRDTRAALGLNRVEHLMRISQEGPPLECFDLTNAIKLWADHPVRRPAKSKRHHNYKKRRSKSNNNNSESSSTDDDDGDDMMSLK